MSAPPSVGTAAGRAPVAGRPATGARLLVADRIVTLAPEHRRARALVVRGGRISWVGDEPEQAPPHAERVDLDGCVLGPAFVDAHVHLTPTGLALRGLDLSGAGSGAEVLLALEHHTARRPGRVVWGHGLDPHGFPDDLPTPAQLSRVSGGRPTVLSRVDGHSCLVDRGTLASAPLARAEGVERDGAGAVTGVLRGEANRIARQWILGAMSEAERSAARHAAAAHAASRGIATVHEMGGPELMGAADLDAWRGGDWPVEVIAWWGGRDLGFVTRRGLGRIGGDLFLDGSLGSHTAALTSPYHDRPDTTGRLEHRDETLVRLFAEATRAGIQVAVHAIGDAAIHQAVRCWERVVAQAPESLGSRVRRLRHRIEHAEVLPPALYDRFAALGLVASVQPAFEAVWGGSDGMYATRLGRRAVWTNPYRALTDRGVTLAFGSDSNVTPMDPWGAVHAAEQREHEQHALDRHEAVSAATVGGRHAAHQERGVGRLVAGMRADLAAWEGDPFRAADPRGATCVLTVSRGRRTYGAGPPPSLVRWIRDAAQATRARQEVSVSSRPDGAGPPDPDDLDDDELEEPDEEDLSFDDLEEEPENLLEELDEGLEEFDEGMEPDDLEGHLDGQEAPEEEPSDEEEPGRRVREGAVTALDGVDESDEDDDAVLREGEFVCRSCHMAKRETALADPDNLLCRDCV